MITFRHWPPQHAEVSAGRVHRCSVAESPRLVNFDKVLPELEPFGGKVLKTSLTNVEDERLRKALEGLNTGGVAT